MSIFFRHIGYGLTETAPVVLLNMPGNKKYASVGVPASATRAKIVAINDKNAVGLAANEIGELWVKGIGIDFNSYMIMGKFNKFIFNS